jgi:hypothetical protein
MEEFLLWGEVLGSCDGFVIGVALCLAKLVFDTSGCAPLVFRKLNSPLEESEI